MSRGKNTTGGLVGKLLPAFQKESLDDWASEIIRKDPRIQEAVTRNPAYRVELLEDLVGLEKKYKGPMKGARLIDSWDRVTSAGSMAAEYLAPGLGSILSGVEEVGEVIPKALYGTYYALKTGDLMAVPYWIAAELTSLLPFGIGDVFDLGNIYVNRVRKRWMKAAGKRFKDRLKIK